MWYMKQYTFNDLKIVFWRQVERLSVIKNKCKPGNPQINQKQKAMYANSKATQTINKVTR